MDIKSFEILLNETVVPSDLGDEEKIRKLEPLIDCVSSIKPSSLFKYRICSENNIDAFYKDEVWVSTASNMNDGFDGRLYFDRTEIKERIFPDISTSSIENFIKSLNTDLELQKMVLRMPGGIDALMNLFIPGTDNPESIRQTSQGIEDRVESMLAFIPQMTQQSTKFCSFSRTVRSASMWGQYSENETGFCIEYDFSDDRIPYSSSTGKQFSHYLLPVVYKNQRFKVPSDYIYYLVQYRLHLIGAAQSHIDYSLEEFSKMVNDVCPCPDELLVLKVLLHKSIEWKFEEEWRLFCTAIGNQNYDSSSTECFKKKPKALYLGRKISEVNEHFLRLFADEKDIPVYKMKLDDDSPSYEMKFTELL